MGEISILHFETIQEEYLSLLRAKCQGSFVLSRHEEILAAIDEGNLKIAAAISDGYYSSELRYDSDITESDQFIRSLDGSPIKGRFYHWPLQELDCPVWGVQLQMRNGKKRYTLFEKDKYDKLAESLANLELELFPVDEYEPEKRSDGL